MSTAGISLPDPGSGKSVKVSVSMPQHVVREVRARVGHRQFSRFVSNAVEQQLRLQMLGEIVDDYVARHGPLPDEIVEEVDEEWRGILGK